MSHCKYIQCIGLSTALKNQVAMLTMICSCSVVPMPVMEHGCPNVGKVLGAESKECIKLSKLKYRMRTVWDTFD